MGGGDESERQKEPPQKKEPTKTNKQTKHTTKQTEKTNIRSYKTKGIHLIKIQTKSCLAVTLAFWISIT